MPSSRSFSSIDAIVDEHEHFQPSLAAAAGAATRLALDPTNRHARQQARAAWHFIRIHALPHMQYEEAVLFPRAVELGASPELIEVLVRDHEELRVIAEDLRALESPGEGEISREQAERLRRFVQVFEWHLGREEALLERAPSVRHAPLEEDEPRRE